MTYFSYHPKEVESERDTHVILKQEMRAFSLNLEKNDANKAAVMKKDRPFLWGTSQGSRGKTNSDSASSGRWAWG